jgi:Tfp pilus assembly protein PilF
MFLGRHEEAALCFQETLLKDPQHLEATVNYCVILFNNKRYDDAVDMLEKACALYKSEPMLWNNLGVAYAAVGLPMDAQAAFVKVELLRRSSASATAFFASSPSNLKYDSRIECNIGVSLCAERDLLRAHEQLMKALEVDSQNKFAWNSMAKVFDFALDEAEAAKDVAAPDEENLFNKCLHSVSQSLCIDRTDATTWNALGVVYLRKGYFKEAAEALRTATTKDPTSGAFWTNYSLSLHMKLRHFKSSSADPTPDEAAEADTLRSALHHLTTKFSDNFSALNSTLSTD